MPVTNVNMETFLSGVNFSRYWSYRGSITTPPCTEGVKWNVVKKVYPISAAQLKEFTDPMTGADLFTCGKGNNRKV